MNAADFRRAIRDSAAYAMKSEPVNIDQRARCFIAFLSGTIKVHDPALAEAMRELVGLRDDIPVALPKAS